MRVPPPTVFLLPSVYSVTGFGILFKDLLTILRGFGMLHAEGGPHKNLPSCMKPAASWYTPFEEFFPNLVLQAQICGWPTPEVAEHELHTFRGNLHDMKRDCEALRNA